MTVTCHPTHSQEVQNQLGHREGIASFLIQPVQRITKYQLLLRDLRKTALKLGMEVPNLEKALHQMQDIPKRANDALALSMICGYEGNIHANGQIIQHVREQCTWSPRPRPLQGLRRGFGQSYDLNPLEP